LEKKRKAVDKRVHEEMKLLQLEEEETINQLMGVRKKIKTNCLALCELNLYHQQVQSKVEEVEKTELKVISRNWRVYFRKTFSKCENDLKRP